MRVVFGRAKLEKNVRVVEIARQLFNRMNLLFESRAMPCYRLGLLRVLPKAWCEGLLLEVFDLRLELREVKDAPLAP